jgi:hypothetical protein
VRQEAGHLLSLFAFSWLHDDPTDVVVVVSALVFGRQTKEAINIYFNDRARAWPSVSPPIGSASFVLVNPKFSIEFGSACDS